MTPDELRQYLQVYFDEFRQTIATDAGDWVVKGFIDVYRNVYTISVDTKVISKIVELMLFPVIARFALTYHLQMTLSAHQNHYPDITFTTPDGLRIALDLKSTYRIGENTVNGFTLGAFTGYFRQRKSTKNITFPYETYQMHLVLGVIYSRPEAQIDEKRVYKLDELESIVSAAGQFTFLLQEKWRIASDQTGSGNTKNIGSVRDISALVEGKGTFADYSEKVFDDYWMNFLTSDMARAIDSVVPYHNLSQYRIWRGL